MLRELSDRQSEVRELISTVRKSEDKTVAEGLAGNLGYSDEAVTALVLVAKEMSRDPESEVTVIDLVWAGGFLDHLDTLGFTVTRKF